VTRQQRRKAARQADTSAPAHQPVDLAGLFQRGLADHRAGRLGAAETAYRQVLAIAPSHADALHLLGVIAHQVGRNDMAIEHIRRAIALRGDFPEACNHLGAALGALGRLAEAAASCREAIRLRPNFPDAHSNLGAALAALGRLEEAAASYREALRLRPDFPEVHNNLGNTLRTLGDRAAAAESYRAALRLRPDYAEAHNNLGSVLWDAGRPAEAEACYRAAMRLRPDLPDPHNNLAQALLLAGRLREGWTEYEWRWKIRDMSGVARHFPAPPWNGEPIGDRVILLHAEQGLGDALQFCRYAPLIGSGAKVILEVQAPLARLLSRLPGVADVVVRGDSLPAFDLHCPLMSLPRAFGTTLDSIPAATPYLAADPALIAAWHDRLAGLGGLRVGLVWAGGQRLGWPELVATDRRRSVALDTMAPLGDVPGVSFISLQKGAPASQAATPPRGMALHDFTADLHDFADTAALIEGLDLVIGVDTAVVHLAGALGKPVWLLNRFDTDWRWLLNREDSPWYPTLRQFRQPGPGDWNSVIGAVRGALQRLAAGNRDELRPRHAVPGS
jgi:Flp pilus assembly protein TadD